jgi:ABC-type sugar transport system permease subunit
MMMVSRMIELAAAAALLGLGIWLYRRRAAQGDDGGYGSQGAVLLFVVAVIMGIHALGGLDYHPTASELEILKDRGR